jgi:hypothetical protein
MQLVSRVRCVEPIKCADRLPTPPQRLIVMATRNPTAASRLLTG